MDILTEFFRALVIFLICQFACSIFLEARWKRNKNDILLLVFILCWLAVSVFFGQSQWGKWLVWLTLVPIPFLLFKGKWSARIRVCLGMILILFLSEGIIFPAFQMIVPISQTGIPYGYTLEKLTSVFSFFLFYYILSMIRAYKDTGRLVRKNPYFMTNSAALLLIVLILFFVLMYYDLHPRQAGTPDMIDKVLSAIFTLVIGISILIFELYKETLHATEKSMQEQLKLQAYQMKDELYYTILENMKKLSSLRHDFKHHLMVIGEYLKQREYEAIENYLKQIGHYVEQANEIVISSNKTISAILTVKRAQCLNLGISFDYYLDYEIIYLQDMDISTLLVNILDNAIEAAEGVGENKKIQLEIIQEKEYLIIFCQNTYRIEPVSRGGHFLTIKPAGKPQHGIGLKNIKEIIEKYQGELKISHKQGLFELQAMTVNTKYHG